MKFIYLIFFSLIFVTNIFAQTEKLEKTFPESPYGEFRKNYRKGMYGKPFLINSKEEAMDVIRDFYSDRKIKFGDVKERKKFYIIEVLDESDNLIDIILVNKRSGRIRSIY